MMDAPGHAGDQSGRARTALPLALIAAGAYWLYRSRRHRRDAEVADILDYGEYSEFDFGPVPVDRTESDGGLRGRARGLARRTKSGFEHGVEHQPLTLAALAIAAGFLLGIALPGSDCERRVLGQTRDRLVGKAQDVARDAKDRVREAVGLATETT